MNYHGRKTYALGAAMMVLSVASAEDQTVNGNLVVNGAVATVTDGNGNAAQLDLIETAGGHDWALVSWGGAAGGGNVLNGKFSIFDNTSGGHRLTIDAAGNVGIGTIAPVSGRLQIQTDANVPAIFLAGNQAGWGSGIQFANTTPTTGKIFGIYSSQGGTLNFSDNAAGIDRVRFEATGALSLQPASGNVGVGTTSPNAKLDVNGNLNLGTAGQSVQWSQYSYGSYLDLDNSQRALRIRRANDLGIILQVADGGSYFGLGNVGIGTTSPLAKLDVAGNANISDTLNVTRSATFFSAYSRPITIGTADSTNVGGISFHGDAGGWAFGSHVKGGDGTDRGGFGFFGHADEIIYYYIGPTYNNASMTIAPSGDTAIRGSLTVGSNLNVVGTLSAPAYAASSGSISGGASGLTLNAGGTNQNVTITPSGSGATLLGGNVGIGTSSPTAKLAIAHDPGANTSIAGLRITNQYSGQAYAGDITLYDYSDATGGAITFAATPTPGVGGTITNLTKQYGGSARGGSAIESINGSIYFHAVDSTNNYRKTLAILNSGNIGVGTAAPDSPLTVKGKIHATEVVVDSTIAANDIRVRPAAWADDVFEDGHRLASLGEVEQHIKTERHLPGIPSAKDIADNGVSVGEMQSALLRKIEELTLHVIRIEKENAELRKRFEQMEGGR